MARTSLTTVAVTRDGTPLNLTAPTAEGDVFDAGSTILFVQNVGAAAVDVTVQATPVQDGLSLEAQVSTVQPNDIVPLGPWPARTFGQPDGANASGGDDAGRVYVNYSTPADVLRQVVAL